MQLLYTHLGRINPRLLTRLEKILRRIPSVQAMIEKEYQEIMDRLEPSLKPYRGDFPTFSRLPETGRDRQEIIAEMEALRDREAARWKDGFVSGAVYHGDQTYIDFLNRVNAIHSQANPLDTDL
ncbi:MAG: hypothetical protein Q8N45_04480, partial [Anaerolineales bacterium]|nr:hypothetical protein [Anaerolineales bacterium]